MLKLGRYWPWKTVSSHLNTRVNGSQQITNSYGAGQTIALKDTYPNLDISHSLDDVSSSCLPSGLSYCLFWTLWCCQLFPGVLGTLLSSFAEPCHKPLGSQSIKFLCLFFSLLAVSSFQSTTDLLSPYFLSGTPFALIPKVVHTLLKACTWGVGMLSADNCLPRSFWCKILSTKLNLSF